MSTRVRPSHGLAERLRDPLWLPLLSAACAFLAFEVAGIAVSHPVLVAARDLAAGTRLSPAVVRTVRWTGSLPGPVLARPQGRLRVAVAAGLPLLRSTVMQGAPPRTSPLEVVGIPSTALLSAPPLSSGETVAVYLAEGGMKLQCLLSAARVVSTGQDGTALAVPPANLPALLAGVAAGHLIIVARPPS